MWCARSLLGVFVRCLPLLVLFSALSSLGADLFATFSEVPAGSVVDLTSEGNMDWVHWGLFTETSLNRKAGVAAQISDFTLLDAPTGFAFVYQFSDNANGYSWHDGAPTASVTNTTTGVWAYGVPPIDSGFEISAPGDTDTRTLKVYVGCYGARGKLEAFLSDGSAQGYTNSMLLNHVNGPGAVYAITYSAASAGQQLVVRWTVANPMRADGNVTLQAAALTSETANNPPFVLLTSPTNNMTAPDGSPLVLTANANDTDGSVSKVEFFSDGTKIGEDTTSPYSDSWNNPPAGLHVLTARATDDKNTISESARIEIFVHGAGGSLAGALTTPPTAVNLTTEGTRDWVHWGLATNSMVDRKTGVAPQISNYTKIGDDPVARYADNYTAFSWSDGEPTVMANDSPTGVFTTGVTNGFEITVPADTTRRTLRVYAGLYGAEGNFQAWLSDFSAAAYTDTTLSSFFDSSYGLFFLSFTETFFLGS